MYDEFKKKKYHYVNFKFIFYNKKFNVLNYKVIEKFFLQVKKIDNLSIVIIMYVLDFAIFFNSKK